MKQLKKGRLWLNDGSCVRLRPEYRNHVWSYDFVHHRTDDGRAFRTLNILDEHSRECLAIRVKRKLNSTEVIDALTDLCSSCAACPPASGRITAQSSSLRLLRDWIRAVGAKTAYIEPGSPWGKRLLRKLQWADARRIAQRRDLLLAARSTNHHRTLEEPLQHEATTQCIGLPPHPRRESHHPGGPEAESCTNFQIWTTQVGLLALAFESQYLLGARKNSLIRFF